MSAPTTLTVILKGEDWTFRKKYLVYETVTLDDDCEVVQKCKKDAEDHLKVTPEDLEYKTSQVVK